MLRTAKSIARRSCVARPRWYDRRQHLGGSPHVRHEAGSGIGAPKGTPAEIVEKLNKEINAAISDPDMKARLADLGGIVLIGQSGPKSTSAFLPLLEE